jgi:hypothetical protein
LLLSLLTPFWLALLGGTQGGRRFRFSLTRTNRHASQQSRGSAANSRSFETGAGSAVRITGPTGNALLLNPAPFNLSEKRSAHQA